MLFYAEELNFKGPLKVQRARVHDSVRWVEGALIQTKNHDWKSL